MKIKIISLFIFLFPISLFSQNGFKDLIQKHPLHTTKQCRKAEKIVVILANYLINNPLNKEANKRINADRYIQKWIIQTPDYYFEIPQEINKISKNNKRLRAVHKALLVKYALSHKNSDTKSKHVRKIVLKSLLNYIEKPKNMVRITEKIKGYIQLKNQKKLNTLIQ